MITCAFVFAGVHFGLGRHNLNVPEKPRIEATKVCEANFLSRNSMLTRQPVPGINNDPVRGQHDVHQAIYRRLPPPPCSSETLHMDITNLYGHHIHLVDRHCLLSVLPMQTSRIPMGRYNTWWKMCIRRSICGCSIFDLRDDNSLRLALQHHADLHDLERQNVFAEEVDCWLCS
jgi:hypothetical protein